MCRLLLYLIRFGQILELMGDKYDGLLLPGEYAMDAVLEEVRAHVHIQSRQWVVLAEEI